MFVPDIFSACASDSYSDNFENILNNVTLAIQFKHVFDTSYSRYSIKVILLKVFV